VIKGKSNAGAVVHLHKAIEACSMCIGHLSVVENTQVGYGISEPNKKKLVKVLKAMKRQASKMSIVSRRWMR